jgi:hypothetical protein
LVKELARPRCQERHRNACGGMRVAGKRSVDDPRLPNLAAYACSSHAPGDTQTFVGGGRPSAGLASWASECGAGGRVGRPQRTMKTPRAPGHWESSQERFPHRSCSQLPAPRGYGFDVLRPKRDGSDHAGRSCDLFVVEAMAVHRTRRIAPFRRTCMRQRNHPGRGSPPGLASGHPRSCSSKTSANVSSLEPRAGTTSSSRQVQPSFRWYDNGVLRLRFSAAPLRSRARARREHV